MRVHVPNIQTPITELLGAAHEVLGVAFTPVNENSARGEPFCGSRAGGFGRVACRQHQPQGSKDLELLGNFFQRPGSLRASRGVRSLRCRRTQREGLRRDQAREWSGRGLSTPGFSGCSGEAWSEGHTPAAQLPAVYQVSPFQQPQTNCQKGFAVNSPPELP